jgi:hypothetical protein
MGNIRVYARSHPYFSLDQCSWTVLSSRCDSVGLFDQPQS